MKNYVGDAARYLDTAPANVSCRYDILRSGVALLRNLHEKENEYASDGKKVRYHYDRIVVIGHSLGSVIAYDLLKYYWGEINRNLPVDDEEVLKETEKFGRKGSAATCEDFLAAGARYLRSQHNLWRDLNKGRLEDKDRGNCT